MLKSGRNGHCASARTPIGRRSDQPTGSRPCDACDLGGVTPGRRTLIISTLERPHGVVERPAHGRRVSGQAGGVRAATIIAVGPVDAEWGLVISDWKWA